FRPVPDDPEEYFLHAGSETAQFDPAAASERFDPLAELTARSDNWMRSIGDRPANPAVDRLYRDQVPAEELAQLLAAATAPVPLPDTASSSRDMELEITRTTPESAGNGQPLVYSIQLENRGSDPIDDVTVQEQLPAGARLAGTTPHTAVEQDHLLWRIRQLKPGGKTSLRVELQPETTGTLSGSATVRTTAAVGSTTTVESGLQLSLEVLSPERVRVGEECPLNVIVTNSGSATAEGVAIHADLPAELGYHKGRTLIYQIGSLPAGETHTAHLTAVGSASGTGRSLLKVVTSSDSQAPMEKETTVDVYPAAMRISRIGPETLHRGSTAHFENRLENLTEEPLTDVTLVEVVPEGVEVLSVGDGGKYDRGTGTITWQIDRIPAGSPVVRTVDLKYNREGRSLSDLTAQTTSRSLDDRRFIASVAPPAAPRAERQTDREPARRPQQERPASRARGFLPCQPRPLVCR
ncbi:MAG: DUF11 domain-containing protein, partial [Planctomycetaceae bacterium]|nr:DUF11 domain-containing protein [Planctomycetaceae bacterium]